MYALMSCSAETASRMKSKLFTCLLISSVFREITTSSAPRRSASSFLLGEVVNTTTCADGQDIRMVSKEELHRSIAWAYKWVRRFDKEGLEGLKNKPRSGRPPDIPQEKLRDKKGTIGKSIRMEG